MFLDQSATLGVGSCYRNMATPSGTIWMEWGKGQGMNPRKGVRVMSPSAPWALSGCWRCSSEHHNVPALRAHETLDRHCPEITGPRGRVQILPRGSCPDARSGHFAHSRLGPLDSVPHLGQHPRAELEFQSRDGAERPGLPAGRVRGLESVRGVFIARTTALRYGKRGSRQACVLLRAAHSGRAPGHPHHSVPSVTCYGSPSPVREPRHAGAVSAGCPGAAA